MQKKCKECETGRQRNYKMNIKWTASEIHKSYRSNVLKDRLDVFTTEAFTIRWSTACFAVSTKNR